jgi:hypothetical protein
VDIGQIRVAELWEHYNKRCCRTTEEGENTKKEIRLSFPLNFSE